MNRRGFLQVSAIAGAKLMLLALDSQIAPSEASTAREDAVEGLSIIDYRRAFITGKAARNRVRFSVDSRVRLIDERLGRHEDFYQCAVGQTEHTFADSDLFTADTADFIVIFGPAFGIKFRRTAHLNPGYRQVYRVTDLWGGQVYRLPHPPSSQLLSTNESIRKATHEDLPLVGQTEIRNPATGLHAIVEFPVKTMNIHDRKDLYQVDTGPVLYPDLTLRHPRLVYAISLAFVAFNSPHVADFVIEDGTPILEAGHEVTRVHHYSRRLSVPAQNRLFAIPI